MNTKFIRSFIFFSLLFVTSCAGNQNQNAEVASEKETLSIRQDMQGVYPTISELYSYIWSDKEISKPESREEISEILDNLIDSFHKIDEKSQESQSEPGFKAAFDANLYLLEEVKKQVPYASDDYLKWRLRGVTANCASCHTRLEAPRDFPGAIPESRATTVQGQIAQGDFLIATRQFKTADTYFLNLSNAFIDSEHNRPYFWEALKRYVMVVSRVEREYREASENLIEIKNKSHLSEEETYRLGNWIAHLSEFKFPKKREEMIPLAKALLITVLGQQKLDIDEDNYASTILATSLIHHYLSEKTTEEERREALLLLAQAYSHLPLDLFSTFPELYLTQCITEFPGTAEAKTAYRMLQERIYFMSSGSGGMNVIPEDARRLRELRAKAYGSK
jgi:hypothetical protein